MKNIFLSTLIALAFSAQAFGDGWGSIVTSAPNLYGDGLSNYADMHGIHSARLEGFPAGLVYRLLNSSGVVVRTSSLDSYNNSPVIVGQNGTIYIVYEKAITGATNILIKKSTDAGATWTNPTSNSYDILQWGYAFNNLDAAISSDGIHIVFSIGQNSSSYEVYYVKYKFSDGTWVDWKNVTDASNENGVDPSIALSNNRIHISYTLGNNSNPFSSTMIRDKLRNESTWGTRQQVNTESYSGRSSLCTDNNYVYMLYATYNDQAGTTPLKYARRVDDGSQSDWGDRSQISSYVVSGERPRILVTSDGSLYALYSRVDLNPTQYRVACRKHDSGGWETETTLSSSGIDGNLVSASATSNDVFVNWIEGYDPESLMYRQYDATPTTPQNMAIGSQNQVHVNWSANPEPDLQYYEVWRKYGRPRIIVEDWTLKATTSSTTWTDPEFTLNPPGTSYTAWYKVRAMDVQSHYSSFSSEVSTGGYYTPSRHIAQAVKQMPKDYSIQQNYPNPFNPSTTISYAIPEPSNVTIIVYDRLGRRVQTLIDSYRDAGFYDVNFDGAQLASGIYFYKMQAGKFLGVKKMLLTK